MVSISGSSTRKVAHSWQNSPNSISPDPSSSISSSKSFNSSSVGRKPIALMISPRSSAERKSCLFVSNRSKQTWSNCWGEIGAKRKLIATHFQRLRIQGLLVLYENIFTLFTLRHLISSCARLVDSLIPSKSFCIFIFISNSICICICVKSNLRCSVHLQTLNLIVCKTGCLVNLIKVNVNIRVGRHPSASQLNIIQLYYTVSTIVQISSRCSPQGLL